MVSEDVSGGSLLTYDEIDDLIYMARAGDLESLRESIAALAQAKSRPVLSILHAAVDVDDEGLGSSSCLLHYPAANGNLAVVQYLLSYVGGSEPAHTGAEADQTETPSKAKAPTIDSDAAKFINHQNVSGNTPLHWAGMNGHLAVVKALMQAGADPGIVNSAGRDAVFESDISSKEGAAECAVEMLKIFEGLERANGASASNDIEHGQDEEEETIDVESKFDSNTD